MPIEIRRFGVGHRRPDGPPGSVGLTGQVLHSDGRGTVSELAFARNARIEPHSSPNTTYFIVVEGGGWVGRRRRVDPDRRRRGGALAGRRPALRLDRALGDARLRRRAGRRRRPRHGQPDGRARRTGRSPVERGIGQLAARTAAGRRREPERRRAGLRPVVRHSGPPPRRGPAQGPERADSRRPPRRGARPSRRASRFDRGSRGSRGPGRSAAGRATRGEPRRGSRAGPMLPSGRRAIASAARRDDRVELEGRPGLLEPAGEVAHPDRTVQLRLALGVRLGPAQPDRPERRIAAGIGAQGEGVQGGDRVARPDRSGVDAGIAELVVGDRPGSRSR